MGIVRGLGWGRLPQRLRGGKSRKVDDVCVSMWGIPRGQLWVVAGDVETGLEWGLLLGLSIGA